MVRFKIDNSGEGIFFDGCGFVVLQGDELQRGAIHENSVLELRNVVEFGNILLPRIPKVVCVYDSNALFPRQDA
jgi:hypothetical protein